MKRRSGRSFGELGRRAHMSRSTLHRYCTGQGLPPDAETVTRVARACGADPTEINELLEAWLAAERDRSRPRASRPLRAGDLDAAAEAAGAGDADGSGGDRDGDSDSDSDGESIDWTRTAPEPGGGRRHLARSALAMALAAATVAATFWTASPARAPAEGVAGAAAEAPIAARSWAIFPKAVPASMFGTTVDADLAPPSAAGAVRFWGDGLRWADLQPRPGRFAWQSLDRLVDRTRRTGAESVLTLGGTPAWAAPGARPMPYPDGARAAGPDDLADWDAFVQETVRRYRGRIDAYELWVMANDPRFFTGGVERLVEMTRRAGDIIRRTDGEALVVCPGMGRLWQPRALGVLAEFARLGGYSYCDAAGVDLAPRRPDDPPEAMLSSLQTLDRVMQQTGIHPPLWNTGGTAAPAETAARYGRSPETAADRAARFYLTGLYGTALNLRRMYHQDTGTGRDGAGAGGLSPEPPEISPGTSDTSPGTSGTSPGVDGGTSPPALAVERLRRRLAQARISSCGQGVPVGLPANVWQCEFIVEGERVLIRWTHAGSAATIAPPGATSLERLDGATTVPTRPGDSLTITERALLVHVSRCPDRPAAGPASARNESGPYPRQPHSRQVC